MNKRKILLRILAAGAALFLIYIILSITFSLKGNPITASKATSDIKAYVAKTYPDLDLEVSKANYNFKFSEYLSTVKSRTSKDTRFSITWRKGKIRDNYENAVVNKETTYSRLQQEFDMAVEKIINEEFPYKTTLMIADISGDGADKEKLELDMELDIHNPPGKTSLTIWIVSDDPGTEKMKECLLDIHGLMEKHGIPIDVYSLSLEKGKEDGEKTNKSEESHLLDFPSEKINEEDLENAIMEHQRIMEEKDRKKKDDKMMHEEKIRQMGEQ